MTVEPRCWVGGGVSHPLQLTTGLVINSSVTTSPTLAGEHMLLILKVSILSQQMNVLRWFGHVERMDNERLLKKVMNAKVDGRSARGRPRFGWMDEVKRALNDRRVDIRGGK